MADREFLLRIVGDVSSATKGIDQIQTDVSGMKSTLSNTAKVVGGAFAIGAVVEFGKSVAGAASEAEQASGAIDSVFGDMAGSIHDFSKDAATNLGLATSEYENLATLTGALLKNAGVPLDQVAESTKNLTMVGADLSAMYGGTAADAMGAINSALKGEMDPLEAFGVSLKATTIEAKAIAMGLVDAEGKATDYGKKMATIAIIQEQSADAAGTFADEAGSMAGQTQILSAQFKNLQADLGKKLLPVVVEVAGVLTKFIGFVIDNQQWLLPLAAGIAAVVLAMKAWSFATAAWTTATEIGTAVQTAFNAVMAMNPIGLIVIAVAALVAGFVLLYMKVDWFREGVDAMVKGVVKAFDVILDAIKAVIKWVADNWDLLFVILTGPFGLAVLAIIHYWDDIMRAFKWLIDQIVNVLTRIWNILTYPFRQAIDEVKRIIDAIAPYISGMVSSVTNALSNVWSVVSAPFKSGIDTAKGYIDTLLDKIWRIGGQVYNFMAGVAEAMYAPFRSAFNSIKSLWNNTVGGFGFSVPSWVPGVGGKSFTIPRMAAGGIVNGPTIALIGEAGREAVVPLDHGGIGFGNVTINVYALTANAEVGRRVYDSLREYERTSGRTFDSGPSGGLTVFAS